MAALPDADNAKIPLTSVIFGYGPMAPFVVAAVGSWTLPPPWPALATILALIWGGVILVFLAGVRRGYGFGNPQASATREIAAMLVYFTLGGVSLVLTTDGQAAIALMLEILGFIAAPVLDRRAALAGDAPAYFARLRVLQMTIAVLALLALSAHQFTSW